jgi:ribosomal protein S18 acetylase RimI-like enzyme
MSAMVRFVALEGHGDVAARLSQLCPANPFFTPEYFEARRRTGWTVWVLGLEDDDGVLQTGCAAFITLRGLSRKMELPSLPPLDADSPFWPGVEDFCRSMRVTKLELSTFASEPGAAVPAMGRCTRRARREYVIDLAGDYEARIDRRHRQHIKKAVGAGLELRRTRSPAAVDAHRAAIGSSMDRRRARGEDVPSVAWAREFEALLSSGAGELYQAVLGESVLASGLVLRAPQGAYFHSRGTSPEGMAIGASHYLLHGILRQLSDEGVHAFNIGGADEGSGLERFKSKFGARRVELCSATCYVGPQWRCDAYRLAELVCSDPKALPRKLLHRVALLAVYAGDVDSIAPASPRETPAGLELRPLTQEDLCTLLREHPAFRESQLDRAFRFRGSHAHGAFVDGRIANVSWLLPREAMLRDTPRWRRVREGEAEITAVETLPEFRGRGIHSQMNLYLVEAAKAQGLRRLVAKVRFDNRTSAAGAERAGLRRIGWVILVYVPLFERPLALRLYR